METNDIRPGLKNIAARIENARADFAEILVNLGGVSKEVAAALVDFYLKEKLAKMDAVSGRITVKHGSFLDRVFIEAASVKVSK